MSIDIIKELSTDYNCWCIDVIGKYFFIRKKQIY